MVLVLVSVVLLAISGCMLALTARRHRLPPPTSTHAPSPLTEDMARKLRELTRTRDREQVVLHEHQRLIDRLTRSEANFKVLVESSPDAVFVHRQHVIQYVNPTMSRLLGYDDPRDLVGKTSLETFIHPDDRDVLLDYRRRSAAGEPVGAVQLRWMRRDGSAIVVQALRNAITFDGEPSALVIARDVTEGLRVEQEHAAAQEALRLSEERYRLLFEGSPLPVWTFDAQTLAFLAVNDAAARVYGYSREELLAMRLSDLKPPEDVPDMVERVASDESTDGVRRIGVRRHRTKDGRILEVDIVSHAVLLGGRRTILAIGIDVTQTRHLEEQLRQAQKMEAVGRLAGGVAHDFNNILSIILNYAEFVSETVGPEHASAPDIQEIVAAAKRAAALTHQLLVFSRKQAPQAKVLALNSVVTDVERMLSRVIGEDVQMSAVLASKLGAVEADRAQIEQVLLNLVVNARDAMPDGGRLTIETANVDLDGSAVQTLGLPPGRYVTLAVRDTGSGMEASTVARIFEPFFTTKEVGKGTGLGLATVFGIVKQHGGGIAVDSAPGRGTTFRVYLPRVASTVESLAPESAHAIRRGKETVLVVDDDAGIRAVARRVLAGHGYSVLEARNAHAALDVLHDRGPEVRLLLTDLVMPEIDGRTMAEQVLQRHSHMRVLYMSGYTEHSAVKVALTSADHLLQKPFSARQLLDEVRRALDVESPGA